PGRVIDLRLVPVERRVAVRAAAGGDLGVELRAVRIGVAIAAGLARDREREPRPAAGVTAAARHRDMLALEPEPGAAMLGDAERRRREAVDGVALRALGVARELAAMAVGVARRARAERELAEPLRDRPARRMTRRARHRLVSSG